MKQEKKIETKLKVGDTVLIIAGGNKDKRPIKGKTGKILRFTGTSKEYVVVEGLNYSTHHEKATTPSEKGGRIQKEAPIHVSNVMYFADKLKKPVKLSVKTINDGKKVRGYLDPTSKEFVQI